MTQSTRRWNDATRCDEGRPRVALSPPLTFIRLPMDSVEMLEKLLKIVDPTWTLLRSWQLKGGISARTTAVEVELTDGTRRQLVVRQPHPAAVRANPAVADNEVRVLQAVHTLGLPSPRPIPIPLARDDDSTLTPCLVIEYIEGKPDFAPTELGGYVQRFAEQLAQIHSADASGLDLPFLPVLSSPLAAHASRAPAALDDSLDEGRIRGVLSSAGPFSELNAPALLHGDFWPGNVLWAAGHISGVIDWEEAATGDPLSDLAITRLDLLWAFGLEAMERFTVHYRALADLDYSLMPYWDLWAALRPASQLGVWATVYAPYGRSDVTEATMRARHKVFVDRALRCLSEK